MPHLTFTRSHVRGKKCSLCQTERRTYVQVTYTLGTGFYLVCATCIDGLIGGLDAGEATLPVPKDFTTGQSTNGVRSDTRNTTGVEGFARRHV